MSKVGRPKQFRNAAAKQKAYRERKKQQMFIQERLGVLRNYPSGTIINVVYPGDVCCLCGFTAIRFDAWSLKYKKSRHIPTVYWKGSMLTEERWLICPECVISTDRTISQFEPQAKIGFDDFETYLERIGVSHD